MKKCSKSFLIIFTIFAFWPKMTKNGGFSHFFRGPHIKISKFFARSKVARVKKMKFLLFFENLKHRPFWPKLTQIWPYLAISGLRHGFPKTFLSKIWKKIVYFFQSRKKLLHAKNSKFCSYEHPYDSPLSILFFQKNHGNKKT